MRVAVTSDLYTGLFDFQENVDLFIICGNICPIWDKEAITYNIVNQTEWIEKELNPWLGRLNTDNILAIGGPNDFVAQHYGSNFSFYLNANYIQDEPITFSGTTFYGMPWIPSHYVDSHYQCAFKSRSGELFKIALDSINNNIDVLLTYVAPRTSSDVKGENRGDVFLSNRIKELKKLKLCAYGISSCEKDTTIIKKSRTNDSSYRIFNI
ncbi:hypothetical protein CMI47_18210 [Candidatus Pacearchaeota archaeon]|jgi:hypothetical protein|nr:hypothetical protein [Candidatus Pacearchaeota archaeon]|tara:strand:+ start:15595 stop:16224 length:630 start_codon:yes stop_codon:yes gene_type:complete